MLHHELPLAEIEPFPAAERRDRRAWLSIAMLVLAIKLAILAYGGVAVMVLDDRSVSGRQWLEIWNRWDAPHYLDIARDGYVREGEQSRWIVFFPLFPLLVGGASLLISNPIAAAFAVSAVASCLAAVTLYELGKTELTENAGRDAVSFLLIFPTAYFLHIGYTESAFLALAAGSILCARRGRWAEAGLLGALASLTRINGLVLVPALMVEAFLQYREDRSRGVRRFLWLAAIPAGFAIYLGINAALFGDPFAFLNMQKVFWYKTPSAPWVGMTDAVRTAIGQTGEDAFMIGWSEFGFAVVGLAGTVWCAARMRPTYTVWMTANWLLLTSTTFLLSAPRYLLALFPLFLLLGEASSKRPPLGRAIGILSVLLLALYAAQFARGHWAF